MICHGWNSTAIWHLRRHLRQNDHTRGHRTILDGEIHPHQNATTATRAYVDMLHLVFVSPFRSLLFIISFERPGRIYLLEGNIETSSKDYNFHLLTERGLFSESPLRENEQCFSVYFPVFSSALWFVAL